MNYSEYMKMSYDELWSIHLQKESEHRVAISNAREEEKRSGIRISISHSYYDPDLRRAMLEKQQSSVTKSGPNFTKTIVLLYEMLINSIHSLLKF